MVDFDPVIKTALTAVAGLAATSLATWSWSKISGVFSRRSSDDRLDKILRTGHSLAKQKGDRLTQDEKVHLYSLYESYFSTQRGNARVLTVGIMNGIVFPLIGIIMTLIMAILPIGLALVYSNPFYLFLEVLVYPLGVYTCAVADDSYNTRIEIAKRYKNLPGKYSLQKKRSFKDALKWTFLIKGDDILNSSDNRESSNVKNAEEESSNSEGLEDIKSFFLENFPSKYRVTEAKDS